MYGMPSGSSPIGFDDARARSNHTALPPVRPSHIAPLTPRMFSGPVTDFLLSTMGDTCALCGAPLGPMGKDANHHRWSTGLAQSLSVAGLPVCAACCPECKGQPHQHGTGA